MRELPEASVLDLLKRLRCRICGESRSNLRRVLPVYERLLSPRDDAAVSVQHELMDVRARLLACGDDADVTDVVDRMDHVVERCMGLVQEEQKLPSAEAAVEDVMRLLVALAGGEDGETFVLEDPMRVEFDKSSVMHYAGKKRIGDRIQMSDIGLVHRSKALFNKAPIPMEESKLFSHNLFSGFGNGISRQHTSLWCPDANSGRTENEGFFSMMPLQQPNRFIGIFPGSPPYQNGFGDRSTQARDDPEKRHHDKLTLKTDTASLMAPTSRENKHQLSPSKDVFFYDGTQQVHCDGRKELSDWGEASTITENSSWDSESCFDATEPWIARTYAWEDLGDRVGLPDSYCRPPVLDEKRSLSDIVIPTDFSCRNHVGESPLEVHEADVIEDSLRALCGIDSTIYRREFASATFQTPKKRKLKIRNATISATTSVLELFCKAGTLMMRLELLAIYYSQDPTRGGKTLQAMGDALLLYLSMHRARVDNIARECSDSSFGDDEEDEVLSVTKLICKTRTVCRVLEMVGHIFTCDEDPFWPLLQQGEFPRGIALLDHLHHHVSSLRVEDASGCKQEMATWFLVKSCSPLMAVLSDLNVFGRVREATDPFDEFEVTTWSRNLLGKASAGGGDGLFGEGISTEVTKMLPEFLEGIAPLIVHLSQVQALLRSVNAIAFTHPLVNMNPLIMLHRGDKAVDCAEDWESTISEAIASVEDTRLEDVELDQSMQRTNCVFAEENSGVDASRELNDAKLKSQLEQRNMLDQQVLDRRQRKIQLAQDEEADDAMQIAEANQAEADQEAYARGALLNKYSKLMDVAEERHDYMKWRRDRALRLSIARDQLQYLHADDMAEWTTDREQRRSGEASASVSEVNASKSESVRASGEECLATAIVDTSPVPVSTSAERTSVKVNQEAGSGTSGSTDDGAWRASVNVNKEAGSRTAATTDDGVWKATVKVNKETGSRTSTSTDEGTWRASVKVNKEAGSRTSESTHAGVWRASVKVNEEAGSRTTLLTDGGNWRPAVKVNTQAGNRSSGVLNHLPSSETIAHRTGVRVLNEPGGSGADVYGALYGGINEDRASQDGIAEEKDYDEIAMANVTEDIEMVDGEDPSEVHAILCASLSEVNEDEDVVMQDISRTGEDSASHGSDMGDEVSVKDEEFMEAAQPQSTSTRLSLPPVHPFFSEVTSEEDSEVLVRVLTQTAASNENDFTSFKSIVNCCVEVPVRLVADKLEKVAVDWFRNSLRIVEHLRWMRKLMLMSEGLCMDIFARDFLLGLNSTTRVNWGIEGRLTSALSLAMIEGSVASDAMAQNFHYSTTPALSEVLSSLTMTPAMPTLLGEIELVYDVKWPLGLVITSELLDHYKHMHRFLLHVRLTSLEMREAWALLRAIRRRGDLSPALERLCGTVVYKMQALLQAFNETFSTKVLMSAWSELEHALQKATMLTELRRCHEVYMDVALRCCFLDTPEIHSAFLTTLAAAWSLTAFVRGLDRQVTGRASEEVRIRTLCAECDDEQRALVVSLQSVTRNADRSTREFSEGLLLRLNFNDYYPFQAGIQQQSSD
ncbi:hypothetical protein PR003_g5018 [Phytophthora rubi]|uniref:Uncharacterized protein n=1 Tax=Phytophthora rubi TaxID=129364 RepID=A0A6A3N7X4_9STRA|nr:hypothetical protein PR002_g5008 [Phytophthora rubi]KAE9351161.1 hypothetical protein PR003_g5018 [Phytophthora rubi]